MTDDLELPADEHPEDAPVATYLVRITLRSDTGWKAVAPTLEQLQTAITTMVAASWQGFAVRASAERVDR